MVCGPSGTMRSPTRVAKLPFRELVNGRQKIVGHSGDYRDSSFASRYLLLREGGSEELRVERLRKDTGILTVQEPTL